MVAFQRIVVIHECNKLLSSMLYLPLFLQVCYLSSRIYSARKRSIFAEVPFMKPFFVTSYFLFGVK